MEDGDRENVRRWQGDGGKQISRGRRVKADEDGVGREAREIRGHGGKNEWMTGCERQVAVLICEN